MGVCFIHRSKVAWTGLVGRSTQSLKQGSKNYAQQHQAGRHGAGSVAESSHLIHKQEAERKELTENSVGF